MYVTIGPQQPVLTLCVHTGVSTVSTDSQLIVLIDRVKHWQDRCKHAAASVCTFMVNNTMQKASSWTHKPHSEFVGAYTPECRVIKRAHNQGAHLVHGARTLNEHET